MARNRAVGSRQADGNAETLAQRLFWRLTIADGPYRRYWISDPAMFERVTVADIEQWRRDVLVRSGLILVSAGPMDAADAGREIDTLFAGLPPAGRRADARAAGAAGARASSSCWRRRWCRPPSPPAAR